jgi:hypothetical protein
MRPPEVRKPDRAPCPRYGPCVGFPGWIRSTPHEQPQGCVRRADVVIRTSPSGGVGSPTASSAHRVCGERELPRVRPGGTDAAAGPAVDPALTISDTRIRDPARWRTGSTHRASDRARRSCRSCRPPTRGRTWWRTAQDRNRTPRGAARRAGTPHQQSVDLPHRGPGVAVKHPRRSQATSAADPAPASRPARPARPPGTWPATDRPSCGAAPTPPRPVSDAPASTCSTAHSRSTSSVR